MPDTIAPAIDIDDLRRNIGTKIEDTDIITGRPMAAMNAALDRSEASPAPRETLIDWTIQRNR